MANREPNGITTTANENFSYEDSCLMALLIYKRFARDATAATVAWRRLMGGTIDEFYFMQLVNDCNVDI